MYDVLHDIFVNTYKIAPDGKVSLFVLHPIYIGEVLEVLNGKSTTDVKLEFLVKEIKLVSPQSVLFNWECCSGVVKSLVKSLGDNKIE